MTAKAEIVSYTVLKIALDLLEDEYKKEPHAVLEEEGELRDEVENITFSLACELNLKWGLNTYDRLEITLSGPSHLYPVYFESLKANILASPYHKWVVFPEKLQ